MARPLVMVRPRAEGCPRLVAIARRGSEDCPRPLATEDCPRPLAMARPLVMVCPRAEGCPRPGALAPRSADPLGMGRRGAEAGRGGHPEHKRVFFYYWNTDTGATQAEPPSPWQRRSSRSNPHVYYYWNSITG